MSQGDQPTKPGIGAFDLDSLHRRLGDDPAAVDAVLRAFVTEVPRQITRLREAVAAGAPDQVRHQAHTLKGSLLWIGAGDAVASARTMELSASPDTPISPGAALLKLSADVEHLLVAVQSHLGAAGGSQVPG